MRTAIMALLLSGGVFFFLVGSIGLIRFPDTLTRAHGAAKCDTLGAMLSLSALIVYDGMTFSSFKLIVTIVFLWLTNPTATHLIGNSVFIKNRGTEG
jgi:multicomponent Na+:H+ antiporter subunit G